MWSWLSFFVLTTVAFAQSLTSTPSTAASSSSSSPDYTITALPTVISQAPCVFNCLIPGGLADPSGCDDVSNECACLSAPADVLDFLTSCIQTVCKSSTSSYAAIATSLYEGYCNSVFGTAAFTSAFAAESMAAASSSSVMATMSGMSSASSTASAAVTSSTAKSEAVLRVPSLVLSGLTVSALLVIIAF